MRVKFTIDQGHIGGYNQGAAKGYAEGTAMFHLGVYLKQELELYEGFTAVLTRTSLQQCPTLEERGRVAVNNGSEVFISLHSNGFTSPSAHGVVVFYSLKHPASKALCDKLGKAITDLMNSGTGLTYYRGSQTRVYPNTTNTDYYGVIRSSVKGSSVKASFLVEHGFHSNPTECAWLNSDANLRKLAALEAAVYASHYGVKKIGSGTEPTPPAADEGTVYTVKHGDSLWAIAQELLGDGNSYGKIKALNGLKGNVIYTGQQLKIPVKTEQRTYTVQKGDSFWRIAVKTLGNGNRYKEIAKLNGIDPSKTIHAGQVLKIPS
ncbi:MAG: LysM peptidoglycan-binding domain-containing protein [Oscillospiraceae bacterium]